MVGHELVKKYFPERLKSWKARVAHHHDDMLWYVIFLRITPFLPNWFINLASPIIGVRLMPFFWGTFLGRFVVVVYRDEVLIIASSVLAWKLLIV